MKSLKEIKSKVYKMQEIYTNQRTQCEDDQCRQLMPVNILYIIAISRDYLRFYAIKQYTTSVLNSNKKTGPDGKIMVVLAFASIFNIQQSSIYSHELIVLQTGACLHQCIIFY